MRLALVVVVLLACGFAVAVLDLKRDGASWAVSVGIVSATLALYAAVFAVGAGFSYLLASFIVGEWIF